MNRALRALLCMTAISSFGSARAADLLYTPVNPSFGGSPLNSTHLFAGANAQRTATASDANDDDGGDLIAGPGTGATGTSTIDFDLFVRQLQSRLLSALSSQVTSAIFGEDAQDSGTITFGDQSVTFSRDPSQIEIIITDAGDPGNSTTITIPQVVAASSIN